MRIIPKKSKATISMVKDFTWQDGIYTCIIVGIIFAILCSNLHYLVKLFLTLIFLGVIVVGLLNDPTARRVYMFVYFMAKFVIMPKKYEKTGKRNITKIMPYVDIGNDGIINYGKYYGCVISVGTQEFALLDEFEQNLRISQFAKALNNLSPTSTIQLVKVEQPINYDDISSELYEKVKQSDRDELNGSVKRAIIRSRLKQVDAFNNVELQYRPFFYMVVFDVEKNETINQTVILRDTLKRIGLESEQLSVLQSIVFMKYNFGRNFNERDIFTANENVQDYILPNKLMFRPYSYTIDGVDACTIAISDYPLKVGNCWGAQLFLLENTKVVLTIKPVDKTKAIHRINKAVVEFGSRDNKKASNMLDNDTQMQTMGLLLTSLQRENEMLFDCSINVTAYNYNNEPRSAFKKKIFRAITNTGLKPSALSFRQQEGFMSANISKRNYFKSTERGINSESIASIFPFVICFTIEKNGVLIGKNKYPVILDIWKRGGKYKNSNMFIAGESGGGKSYFGGLLLTLLFADGTQIFILDPENEYNIVGRNLGGKIIDVGNAKEGRLNPFHIYQILTEDGELATPSTVYSAHQTFLENFFNITLREMAADSKEELNNLLRLLYESKGITPYTDVSNFTPNQFPTFTDLMAIVESEIDNEQSQMRANNLMRCKMYLKKFTKGERYSELWNGASTIEASERIVVFNFQSLFATKNAVLTNAQMLIVLRFLEQQIINAREINRNKDKLIHPLVVIDEGYNFIDPEYPIGLDFINIWFRRIRKYEGSMMFLTQSLKDVYGEKGSQLATKTGAILSNSQYSFIFGLKSNDLGVLKEIYDASGGINETEISEIANADVGECFAILSKKDRRKFHIEADPIVESVFKDKYALQKIKRAESQRDAIDWMEDDVDDAS